MSDRDALARLISDDGTPRLGTRRPAQRILDAGWRPPAQVITDPDTPDIFPARTVGIDCDGEVWVSRFTDWVVAFDQGGTGERLSDIVADFGPLTIVYVPAEADCQHDSRSGADGRWRCDECGADCGPNTDFTPTEGGSHG